MINSQRKNKRKAKSASNTKDNSWAYSNSAIDAIAIAQKQKNSECLLLKVVIDCQSRIIGFPLTYDVATTKKDISQKLLVQKAEKLCVYQQNTGVYLLEMGRTLRSYGLTNSDTLTLRKFKDPSHKMSIFYPEQGEIEEINVWPETTAWGVMQLLTKRLDSNLEQYCLLLPETTIPLAPNNIIPIKIATIVFVKRTSLKNDELLAFSTRLNVGVTISNGAIPTQNQNTQYRDGFERLPSKQKISYNLEANFTPPTQRNKVLPRGFSHNQALITKRRKAKATPSIKIKLINQKKSKILDFNGPSTPHSSSSDDSLPPMIDDSHSSSDSSSQPLSDDPTPTSNFKSEGPSPYDYLNLINFNAPPHRRSKSMHGKIQQKPHHSNFFNRSSMIMNDAAEGSYRDSISVQRFTHAISDLSEEVGATSSLSDKIYTHRPNHSQNSENSGHSDSEKTNEKSSDYHFSPSLLKVPILNGKSEPPTEPVIDHNKPIEAEREYKDPSKKYEIIIGYMEQNPIPDIIKTVNTFKTMFEQDPLFKDFLYSLGVARVANILCNVATMTASSTVPTSN